jgi:alanine dehydrogenase
MKVITGEDLDRVLTYPALIEALREAFRADITVPLRHHHPIAQQQGGAAMILLMPAWNGGPGSFLGCKIVTVFPDNAKVSRPSIYGSYMLMSGETGEPLAVMDGTTLTAWRTA